MRIGIDSKKMLGLRHLGMATVSALLVYLFYLSYSAWGVQPALWPDWGQDHPFWRAWAHAAFVLLFLTVILAPAATLWRPIKKLMPWRRELGIWFAVLSLGHAYAIWDRWARRDIATLFGFQYVDELGSYVLLHPEVGIMNMMGMVMLPMIILLAATSFDAAVDVLGASSWRWIHRTLVPVIFYIAMLRGTLYLFYFFQTTPPDWRVYPPIWFLYVFLGMGTAAVLLQGAAFTKIVLQRKRQRQEHGILPVVAVSAVALTFAMPMALMTGAVAYFDSRALNEHPALAQQIQPPAQDQAQAPQDVAQSFEMVIHADGKVSRLWARDLDEAPYLRLTAEVDGSPVSHQIYRYNERTLHTAQPGPDSELAWSSRAGVDPEDIGHSFLMAREPAAWAAQYGTGEHRIQVPEGELRVTINSVDEPIGDEVFEIPHDADPGAQ
jgi:DMSO/TMAO reductase YedYZ heme-binding membrane subunit